MLFLLASCQQKANLSLYPFTDVRVLPKSVMEKYGEKMKIDGSLSIMRERTQTSYVSDVQNPLAIR